MDARRQRPAPKGRVITFYSYKGGTGRSMALANVAWLLAMNGERVLVVDWDLEAPGIHRYFHPLLEDKELLETEGLLDFLEKLRTRAAMSSEPLDEKEVDVIEYVKILNWPSTFPVSWKQFGEFGGALDLLVAGRQGPLYGQRLNAFSFVDFYEKLGGRRLLAIAREQMRNLYDFVLIDSRTGVSDTSGICTVEMPDTLVVCFTLNDQSIIGASGVAQDVLRQRASPFSRIGKRLGRLPTLTEFEASRGEGAGSGDGGVAPPVIFPVPTRVEIGGEQGKLQIALALARKKFAPFLSHLPRETWSKYWGSVQMAYFPFYAFEEIPAVFGDPLHQQISLLTSVKAVARAITGNEALEGVALAKDDETAEKLRNEILGWYLRKPDTAGMDAVQLADAMYEQADPATQKLIRRVMLRLVKAGGPVPVAVVVEFSDLGKELEPVARRLMDAGILYGFGPKEVLANQTVCERWERLTQWVKEDEAFLVWRQAMTVPANSWRLAGKDDSGLLRGTFLELAEGWLAKRADDLNEAEREFIEESRRKKPKEAVALRLRFRVPWTDVMVEVKPRGIGFLVVALLAGIFGDRLVGAVKRLWAPAGEYWTAQASGTDSNLNAIFGTSDGKRLWVVGGEGTILQSTDGRRWRAQTSGTRSYLLSIFGTSDGKQLWAVGLRGTILRSVDGEHWTAESSGTGNTLFSIFGTDDGTRLWAVGEKGTILQSVDGENWTVQASGTTGFLHSIFGTSHGYRLWAVGENGTILRSVDGQQWMADTSGTTETLFSIFGTEDGKRLWAVTTSTMLESVDGGKWTVQPGAAGVFNAIFGTSDGKRLWITGPNTVTRSSDGNHWERASTGTTNTLNAIFGTSDGRRLWAVGQGGTILESHGR